MTLRDKIVFKLEQNRGRFVSGQEIAEAANVSRSAVAKCVTALKSEGYPIKSVNNAGHCLEDTCDIISKAGILAFLDGDTPEIRVFKSIDSTSTEAKRALAGGLTQDAIFIAEEQTAGRGRQGKSFYSPNGKGLYFSMVLHPDAALSDVTGITAAAAVAVCEALTQATKKDPRIKWVNDIFIDNKKVCGILTEAVSDLESGRVQAVVVGIGINVTTDVFPDDLKSIAASIGCFVNRCKLTAEIYKKLKALSQRLPTRDFMEDYRRLSLVLGKEIFFVKNQKEYTARAVNIQDDGGLEVLTDDGSTMVLNSGEISIRPSFKA